MELENPLLKAAYESLNKSFKTSHKYVEKDLGSVVKALADLPSTPSTSKEDALAALHKAKKKVQGIKRKLADVNGESEKNVEKCKARLSHIEHLQRKEEDRDVQLRWNKKRMDRILVDYMLREGFYDTACDLARDSDIEPLTDIDIFSASRRVILALEKRDCSEALAWCKDNSSKLKKMKSNLEFKLRLQEFIELARKGKREDAIAYARKYLSSWAGSNMKEIQQAMAVLAFPETTQCGQYRQLYSDEQWDTLIQQFKTDNNVLFSLTTESLLSISMQAGLSALKTPFCYQKDNLNTNCPVCNETMGKLAKNLPVSHRIHSCLVCRISGDIMNEHNYPLVLPNGNVYSKEALEEMAASANGTITCVRTGDKFTLDLCKKAFIS